MSTVPATTVDLRGNGRRRLEQKVMFGIMGIGFAAVLIPTVYILLNIVIGGIGQLNPTFLLGSLKVGGIFPAVLGTLGLMIGTILLALPLGVFAAIYLSEYATKGPVVRAIRMAIVNLAGVPSIVHGLFGLIVFKLFLGAWLDYFAGDPGLWRKNTLLWGAATLAILVLPVIITATEEALRAVPKSFREGSMGLGATRWQTIYKVVLPAALPGIMTGAILAVGRAAGETAPILLTAAVAFTTAEAALRLNEPVMALPYQLYYVVTTASGVPVQTKYGIALTLLLLVFVVNLAAILIRAHLRRTRRW